jgi:hypothetical protein
MAKFTKNKRIICLESYEDSFTKGKIYIVDKYIDTRVYVKENDLGCRDWFFDECFKLLETELENILYG